MQAVDVSNRRGIKRNCRGEEIDLARQVLSTYFSSMFRPDGGSVRSDSEQVEGRVEVCSSLPGRASIWGAPSTCCCVLPPTDVLEEVRFLRLHIPKTWELSELAVSEGICGICNKERPIRVIQYRPQGVYQQNPQGEGWGYRCQDDSRQEEFGGSVSVQPRVFSYAQKEDRGAGNVAYEEELEATEILEPYSDDDVEPAGPQNSPMVEQQPLSEQAIWEQGIISAWENQPWQDYTDPFSPPILSDLYSSYD